MMSSLESVDSSTMDPLFALFLVDTRFVALAPRRSADSPPMFVALLSKAAATITLTPVMFPDPPKAITPPCALVQSMTPDPLFVQSPVNVGAAPS